MPTTPKKAPIRFEQATARLEAIVEKLDDPDTGLEEMISLVEEGLALIRSSKELLHKAELRIRTLENPEPAAAEAAQPALEAQQEEDGFNLL